MKKNDWVILLCGLITSVAVAVMVGASSWAFGLYNYVAWDIIPLGSLIAGGCAAVGYYLAMRLTQHRPSYWIYVAAVFISIVAYFIIYYVQYNMALTEDGYRIALSLSFKEFWLYSISDITLVSKRTGHIRQLGGWSYMFELWQAVWFAAGGILSIYRQRKAPACGPCQRFYTTQETIERYSDDNVHMGYMFDVLLPLLDDGEFREAFDTFQQQAGEEEFEKTKHAFCLEWSVFVCDECKDRAIELRLLRWNTKDKVWEEESGFSYRYTLDRPLGFTVKPLHPGVKKKIQINTVQRL